MQRLKEKLLRLDGQPYPGYKSIKGSYSSDHFDLDVLHIQGDPFAQPSRVSIRIPLTHLPFDSKDVKGQARKRGFEDAILRSFKGLLQDMPPRSGSGKSGIWRSLSPGQEILPRTACEIENAQLCIRFFVGMPARGRRILGREALAMLTEDLPNLVEKLLEKEHLPDWKKHADSNEDQDVIREILERENWVAFIANGSELARASGIDDRPLKDGRSIAWRSPPSLEKEIQLPHSRTLRGTALEPGVTLICGGGFHGKSTVLHALERGIYNHIPGDGREFCVARQTAVSIRSEEGRSICKVDISPFIQNLPNSSNTSSFSSLNGSGSTSQAANISEAIELGAEAFLIDEDTSATNFMIRDRRMQDLVQKDDEPITPFLDRVRELYEKLGISSILVLGGSGDYFDVADRVITMRDYVPHDLTAKAKAIATEHPSTRMVENKPLELFKTSRIPDLETLKKLRNQHRFKVRCIRKRWLEFGREEIELTFLNQLVDEGQARTLGDWLKRITENNFPTGLSLLEIVTRLERDLSEGPLSRTTEDTFGDRVFVRRFEFAAALNRLRILTIL